MACLSDGQKSSRPTTGYLRKEWRGSKDGASIGRVLVVDVWQRPPRVPLTFFYILVWGLASSDLRV